MRNLSSMLLMLLFLSTAHAAEVTPLVDVAWIKANSCNEGVRVLDIRNRLDGGSQTDYLRAHIPCAVYTDYMKAGWRTKVNDVPGQLPPVDKLEKLIGSLGIDNDTHVVIYHAGTSALDAGSATRVYWTFKVLGHDKVSILDGGFLAYAKDKKNKLDKGSVKPEPKTFKANLRTDMLAGKQEVQKALDAGTPLVDMRPSHQYVGINRHAKAKRNGTIPSSVNLPEAWLTVNGGGKFRSTAELEQLYALAKAPTSGEAIMFCNTGHWASLGWFVSSELMGNKETKVYDGSMVEWSADSNLPMDRQVILK